MYRSLHVPPGVISISAWKNQLFTPSPCRLAMLPRIDTASKVLLASGDASQPRHGIASDRRFATSLACWSRVEVAEQSLAYPWRILREGGSFAQDGLDLECT